MFNTSLQQQKVLRYRYIVRQVMNKVRHTIPSNVAKEDLEQTAYLGLIDAIDKYDADRCGGFERYAYIRVQGSVIDELRKRDWVPRSTRKRVKEIAEAKKILGSRLNREPKSHEIATFLGMDLTTYLRSERKRDLRSPMSMEETVHEGSRVGDMISSSSADPSQVLQLKQDTEILSQSLSTLNNRERTLIERYYYQSCTFKQIAGEFQVTESRISQLHAQICGKLKRAHLRARAV